MRQRLAEHPRLADLVEAWCAEAQQLFHHVAGRLVSPDQLPNHVAVFEECLMELRSDVYRPADYPASGIDRLERLVAALHSETI